MGDPLRGLSGEEVAAAGLGDWRQLRDSIQARYRMPDYASGLKLVAAIGAAAEAANHHPDITLTYAEVIVTVTSHDVGAVTSRDVELARRISELAAAVGATPDVSG